MNNAYVWTLALVAVGLVAVQAEEPRLAANANEGRHVKVPARKRIVKAGENDASVTARWARDLIRAKEQLADQELGELTKKIRAEEAARWAAERERRRRQELYERSLGGDFDEAQFAKRLQPPPVRVKLAFVVPEIKTYEYAAGLSRARQVLAQQLVAALSSLDRDGNGVLTEGEYRDAAALVRVTQPLLRELDRDGDGSLTHTELDEAATLPATGAAVLEEAHHLPLADGHRLANFDANSDGRLEVAERKSLTMAFVAASLRATQDGAFYQLVAEKLDAARAVVARRFENIEIKP